VVLSGDVDWQRANVVGWQCLTETDLQQSTRYLGLVVQTSAHCYGTFFVLDAFRDVSQANATRHAASATAIEERSSMNY